MTKLNEVRDLLLSMIEAPSKRMGDKVIIEVNKDVHDKAAEWLRNTDADGNTSYVFYFLSGQSEVIRGASPSEAFSNRYNGGAIRSIDFFEPGTEPSYDWESSKRQWVKNRGTSPTQEKS